MKIFPHFRQMDRMDCGPSCLRIIACYMGKNYSIDTLRKKCSMTRNGVSMNSIKEAAHSIGMKAIGLRITIQEIQEKLITPCILHWNQHHFVVLYKIKNKCKKRYFYISDPASKKIILNETEFCKCWLGVNYKTKNKGVALFLEPTPDFYKMPDEKVNSRRSIKFIFKYLRPYHKAISQIILGMFIASVLQLIFPFLTQSIVDIGIKNSSVNFIALILIGQLIISISQLVIEYIRNWLLLHINSRVNIALISDFLIKLMKLPLSFFDSKNIGDIMQRIGDHHRIEQFLMGTSLTSLFSFISFFIFSIVLFIYNPLILFIFTLGNSLYVIWVLFFMKYRRELDYRRFSQSASEQSSLIQLITGMQEIKLNCCEKEKRWQWERIQLSLYRINIKSQALGQIQQIGSIFFSQITNLIITFIVARNVIEGTMTLGMMVALTYIIGMLMGPINSLISFIRQFQDAKISLERLNEIHDKEDDENNIIIKHNKIPSAADINVKNVTFGYNNTSNDCVLKDINLNIPYGKITAIVGKSGSGKTTLIKMLLGFYTPLIGEVRVGGIPLTQFNPLSWRSCTGAVLQDGYIFSDTISNNICLNSENIDSKKLSQAVNVANIANFIDSLPLGYETRIGMEGDGISQGQRQRILLARVVYKNPDYIFLDEATNALDSNNEKVIMNNLNKFYKGKTVVISAHRLSTVRNADNIIVMNNGQIVEQGTHEELIKKRGHYYKLVKNQIENINK